MASATQAEHDKADTEAVIKEFHEAVNMTAGAIEEWLQTPESREVGFKGADGKDESAESVGHKSGKKIVEILHKKKSDFSDEDLVHMKKVVGYVHRHLAQKPKSDDLAHTHWTYSLKNWGHDPGKDK